MRVLVLPVVTVVRYQSAVVCVFLTQSLLKHKITRSHGSRGLLDDHVCANLYLQECAKYATLGKCCEYEVTEL